MNTSNIDALATAAEVRANQAKEELTFSSVTIKGRFGMLAEVARAAVPPPRDTTVTMPPLPPVGAVPRLADTSGHLQISHQHHDVAQHQVQAAAATASAPSSSRRKPSFADKLHAVLSNKHLANTVTWLPSGKAFCILDKESFTKKVLPTYFREAKFESFSRRIKRWGFRKMHTTGLKQVIYTHDLFQRDCIDLSKMMNGRAGQAASSAAPQDVVVDAAKFEDAMTEQVALAEKGLEAYHRASASPAAAPHDQEKQKMMHKIKVRSHQVPVKKRFVPSQQEHHTMHRQQFPMKYEPIMSSFPHHNIGHNTNSMMNPMTNHMDMNMYQMGTTTTMYPLHQMMPSHASNFQLQLPQRQAVSYPNPDVARQLSSLDEDIAECKEILTILQRLKALKDKRRALGCES
jgi:hypothetical protein